MRILKDQSFIYCTATIYQRSRVSLYFWNPWSCQIINRCSLSSFKRRLLFTYVTLIYWILIEQWQFFFYRCLRKANTDHDIIFKIRTNFERNYFSTCSSNIFIDRRNIDRCLQNWWIYILKVYAKSWKTCFKNYILITYLNIYNNGFLSLTTIF